MIELSIPQAGEDTKNAKDLVFSILSSKQPLTMIEIVNIIHKQYNVSLTYQAVKKAIDNLIQKKVLVKNGKHLKINKEWLINLKIQIDNMIAKYETGKVVSNYKAETLDHESSVYTFSTLIDLDNFWNDILMYLADNLKEDETKIFITISHYPWWLLINLGKETKTFDYYNKKGIKCYTIHHTDYPLTLWGKKIYADVGMDFAIFKDSKAKEWVNMNVIGDTIIQITYSKDIIEKVKEIYKKYGSLDSIGMQEIAKLAYIQCEAKFNVFKNPEIAQSLRERYLKLFKKK
jgi:hypothetical protein